MDDLISRQAAIEALGEKPLAWTESEYEQGLQNQWEQDVDALMALPAADVRPMVHDDDMKRAARAAQRALARIPAAQRWIPVTERLPELDGWYWVYAPEYKGGSSSGLKFIDGMMLSKFKSGRWSIEHGYYKRPGCVTHWMPLPEPPKEEA